MLDAIQPLLPLLDLRPHDAPPRRPRRRAPAVSLALPGPVTILIPAPIPVPAPSPIGGMAAGELRAARQVYLGLATRWVLTGHEALVLLGEPGADDEERQERLLALMGVTRLLHLAWPEPERARAVLRQPLPLLGDAAPLTLMLAGGCPAIRRVRAWLAEKAG